MAEQKDDDRTLADLARLCLHAQDASNLCGLAQEFPRTMLRLRRLVPGRETDFYNHHPIIQAWTDKMADLSRSNRRDWHSFDVYEILERMAKGQKVD